MSTRAYHLRELAIARSPDDIRYVMPKITARHRRILDVGCGAGQTLIASELAPDVQAVGIDIDQEALELGGELTDRVRFVAGGAEALPFADGSFDLVIARVALPLTYVPAAVAEMGRVLAPGGDVWLVLHSLNRTIRLLAGNARHLQAKRAVYRSYVLANGSLYHLTGRMVPLPTSGRYETFQTDRSIARELRRAGFGAIRTARGYHYIVSATKLPPHDPS
jgi:ubiquinone/menaquinone biosynthesis C-methylase UbiE